jgi:hypothetical protein
MEKEKKKTFTYATIPSIRERATKKASKNGHSLSEIIDMFLREYVKNKSKIKINPYPQNSISVPLNESVKEQLNDIANERD